MGVANEGSPEAFGEGEGEGRGDGKGEGEGEMAVATASCLACWLVIKIIGDFDGSVTSPAFDVTGVREGSSSVGESVRRLMELSGLNCCAFESAAPCFCCSSSMLSSSSDPSCCTNGATGWCVPSSSSIDATDGGSFALALTCSASKASSISTMLGECMSAVGLTSMFSSAGTK